MVTLFLVFQGIAILFSTMAAPIYIPTNSVGGFPLHPLQHLLFVDFSYGHSDQCKVILHGGLDLHFSNNVEHIFMCLLAISISSLEKCVFRSSACLKNIFKFLFIFGCAGSYCCEQAFSSCSEWGATLCSAWASHCSDFSCCGAWVLGLISSVVAHGLSSCGTWAQLLHSMWDLSRPSMEPVYPDHWTTREVPFCLFFFFYWIVCFSDTELYELFVYFGNYACVGHIICKYFFPFCRLFPFCLWFPLLFRSF